MKSLKAPRIPTATGTATTTAFFPLINTAEVATAPAEYADLLNPDYNGQVALSGDPLTSNAAMLSVWAAGLATGATGEEAAQAGLEFFSSPTRLATSSRSMATPARWESGRLRS